MAGSGAQDSTIVISSSDLRPDAPPQIPDYNMVRRIGKGGYGEVWLAKNALGTYRAIKIVYREKFKEDRPYEREFDGIRKFEPVSGSHPGLLTVLHVGRNDQAKYFYYVMEAADDELSGQAFAAQSYQPKTLSGEVSRRGCLPLEECVQLGLSLTDALEHLHRNRLIHRDIKPANIIFLKGTPRLADIGLVTDIQDGASLVGTEYYFAPEGPGRAADIYALGKVLYVISTGRPVQEFPDLPTFSTAEAKDGFMDFNKIVLKACARNCSDRYKTARALHRDLELLAQGKPAPWPRSWFTRLFKGGGAEPQQHAGPLAGKRLRTAVKIVIATFLAVAAIIGFHRLTTLKQVSANVLPASIRNLPAGDILTLISMGSPPSAKGEMIQPQLQFELMAMRKGEPGFRPLNDGDALASEADDYLVVMRPLSPGYLYVFQIDSSGKCEWLFPQNSVSRFSSGANPVIPRAVIRVPPEKKLYLDKTVGVEHIYAVLSATPWAELEKLLSNPAAPRPSPQVAQLRGMVQQPNQLRLRGIEGDRFNPAVVNVDDVLPPEPADVAKVSSASLGTKAFRATGWLLVVERWFRHEDAN